MTENFVQWRKSSSFNRKFIPVRGNFSLWQDISSCDKKFLPVTGNFSLRQEMSSYGMKFLTQNFFPGQDISGIFHPSDIKTWQKCVIFGYITKSRQKCMLFVQNFAWEFKAFCQDSWHLGRQSINWCWLAPTPHIGPNQIWTDIWAVNYWGGSTTFGKIAPKSYLGDTLGVFQSYINHILAQCFLYFTNISPIHQKQGHIAVIWMWGISENLPPLILK